MKPLEADSLRHFYPPDKRRVLGTNGAASVLEPCGVKSGCATTSKARELPIPVSSTAPSSSEVFFFLPRPTAARNVDRQGAYLRVRPSSAAGFVRIGLTAGLPTRAAKGR